MNIVFGGSFNPPTIAHYEIAKFIIEHYDIENLIFLPVGTNYFHKYSLAPNKNRVEMLEILAKELPKTVISDAEMTDDYQGTYYSLKKLQKEYKDLYFVLGADNLVNLKNWINAEKLISEFMFMVLSRNKGNAHSIIDELFPKQRDHFIVLPIAFDVSSTEIRNDIEKNRSMLLNEIYEYIKKNKMYEGED